MLELRMSAALNIMLLLAAGDGRLGFREVQRYIQRIQEFVDLDRFGEIAEESCLQTLLDIAGYGIGTERDDRDARRDRILGEDSQRFDTADAWQIDVHEDDVRQ